MSRDTAGQPSHELVPLALAAAAVTAVIELPVSQHYATVPPTSTAMRMAIAGVMAGAAVLVGGTLLRALRGADR